MAKIKDIVEQRIKDAARITDILEDGLGVSLHRDGVNLQGLCPFHNDKHLGSFKVSETKNICTCFSCGKTWNPINALMEGRQMDYPTALRWIAAKYGIYVDEEPAPQVKPAQPRQEPKPLEMIYWNPVKVVKPFLHHNDINPLMQYLEALPMAKEDKDRLHLMTELYMIGTYTEGEMKGWTIWWQMDEHKQVRTGKIMKYLPNGHRDKESKYNFNFVHAILRKAGKWDDTQYEYRGCLFGQHLIDAFPKAEICLVESEKSALICSAFTDPRERLWLATAGKSGLSRKKLQPLIDRQRYIVIYPDRDGYNEWRAIAEMIGYNRLSVSPKVNQLWIAADGDKADIADIMLRRLQGITETEGEKAARLLGHPEKTEVLTQLIDQLNLKMID